MTESETHKIKTVTCRCGSKEPRLFSGERIDSYKENCCVEIELINKDRIPYAIVKLQKPKKEGKCSDLRLKVKTENIEFAKEVAELLCTNDIKIEGISHLDKLIYCLCKIWQKENVSLSKNERNLVFS